MSNVLVNGLQVREGPSINSNVVAKYDEGDIINSGDLLIENEGRIWLRYNGRSGNKRYICAVNIDDSHFINVDANVPGPRTINRSNTQSGWELTAYCHCSKCCGKSDRITASG